MIDRGERDNALVVGVIAREPPDRHVEVEEERALGVVPNEALRPEERGDARAARDRRDIVQAGAGIDDHVAGGQLHLVAAVGVLDHELAAVVILGRGDEQRRRHVGADLQRCVEIAADRVVDVRAEGHAGVVAVEQRWKYLLGQHRREEQRVAAECLHHDVAELAGFRRGLGQLQVVLHLHRLVPGGDTAVDPTGLLHHLAAARDLFRREHLGHMDHHGRPPRL